MPRRSLSLAALLAAVTLGAAACGGAGEETTTVATTEPPPATVPPPQPPPPPPPPPPSPPPTETKEKPEAHTVTIVVRGGKVEGGLARETFDKGEKVVLVVRADVSDEVHLHGYDVSADVAPGAPARLAFTASLPGRFEVELEDRGFQIADLEVRP